MTPPTQPIPYTLDIPIHTISRLYAENVCRDAGMDMNRLGFLRYMASTTPGAESPMERDAAPPPPPPSFG